MTNCNDACSKIAPVSIGVAQGFILGPLLFIIYMNDLPDVLQFYQVTAYADDTVLYLSSKSTRDFQRKINADLGRTVFIRLTALGALIKFLDLESGRLFEAGRLLNFHHFQQV